MWLAVHSIAHLARQVELYGPAFDWWEFRHESYLGFCKHAGVQNRNNPGAAIMWRYCLYEKILVLKALLQVSACSTLWAVDQRCAADCKSKAE